MSPFAVELPAFGALNCGIVLRGQEQVKMTLELERLQQQIHRLRIANIILFALLALGAGVLAGQRGTAFASETPLELRVKRLAVVDEKGTERVVIAAPVPDPVIDGKRVKRQGAASGIIIYDANAVERGGYLTSDESSNGAMLTLDSIHTQVVTLYANPDNGATISLNNQKGDGLTLTTWNTPVIQMSHRRQVFFKQPPNAPRLH